MVRNFKQMRPKENRHSEQKKTREKQGSESLGVQIEVNSCTLDPTSTAL